MKIALEEAAEAAAKDEVPVGAVVELNGQIIGRGRNLRETTGDPTAHAEIVALREASRKMGTWRLEGAAMFVTLEPCAMCAGALVLARVRRLVFGTRDPKAGAAVSLMNIVHDERLNHRLELKEGILGKACQDILQEFFRKKRRSNR